MDGNLKPFRLDSEKQPSQAPRDREGSFEPQIIPKRQTNVIGIEDKILALYAKGLSTRDISKALEEIYGFEASHETISNVTDKIIPLIQDWQKRPLRSCLSDHLFRCSSCQSKGRSRSLN